MIDLHHHLLPGLDDGPREMETSVEMARIAAEDGITHVVCTPHANNQFAYNRERVDDLVAELSSRLEREGIALKLGRGCDFHLTYENITDAKEHPDEFSVNGRGYLMMEIPDYGLPPQLTDTFYQLQLAGMVPVLTHPERNATLQDDQERLEEWLRGGVLMQVTAGSVTGTMGRRAQKMAHAMLDRRWVHFIATDAHNTTTRPPRMRAAFEQIATRCGSEYATLLCVSNPLNAFEGSPLDAQPEPADLYEHLEPKSWWQRLTGR